MHTKILALAGAALLALATVAEAKQSEKMTSVVDLIVDYHDWIGHTVTVTDCHFTQADQVAVYCKAGTNGISIDSATMDRESLRRAMKTCNEVETGSQCDASVSGTVTGGFMGPRINNATVVWTNSAATPKAPSPSKTEPLLDKINRALQNPCSIPVFANNLKARMIEKYGDQVVNLWNITTPTGPLTDAPVSRDYVECHFTVIMADESEHAGTYTIVVRPDNSRTQTWTLDR